MTDTGGSPVACTVEILRDIPEFSIFLIGGKLWFVADMDDGDSLHAVTLIHRLELGLN